MQLLGHRYYDDSIGRFISSDPIQNGMNWYDYCENDPGISSDRKGLFPTFGWIIDAIDYLGGWITVGGTTFGGSADDDIIRSAYPPYVRGKGHIIGDDEIGVSLPGDRGNHRLVDVMNPKNRKVITVPIIDKGPEVTADNYWGPPVRRPWFPRRGIDLTPTTANALGLPWSPSPGHGGKGSGSWPIKWRFHKSVGSGGNI